MQSTLQEESNAKTKWILSWDIEFLNCTYSYQFYSVTEKKIVELQLAKNSLLNLQQNYQISSHLTDNTVPHNSFKCY